MRRFLAFMLVLVCLVPAVGFAASEIRLLGGPGANNNGDLSLGTGYSDSTGGRRVYRINLDTFGFPQNTAIKGGNGNLYGLSAGVAQHWGIPYFDGSGNLNWLGMGLSGYCLKFNGAGAAPTAGLCGFYDPAAVAITGGTINGVNIGNSSPGVGTFLALHVRTYMDAEDDKPIYWGNNDQNNWWKSWYDSTKKQFILQTWSTGSSTDDNNSLFHIQVNANNGTLEPAQSVFGIYDYITALFRIYGNGNTTQTGTSTSAGVVTSVANGFRRANVCNTGGIGSLAFAPQGGDLTCVDNVYYAYANGAWATLGSTGAGGIDNTVAKVVVTENFTGTDNTVLADPPWTTITGLTDVIYYSNAAHRSTGDSGAYYSDNTFASNQYSQCKIPVVVDAGPVVRAQAGGAYSFEVFSDNTAGINYWDGSTYTALGASFSVAWSATKVYKLSASGSTLTAYEDGAVVATRTDTNLTGGRPGIYISGSTSRVDDWEGGDL